MDFPGDPEPASDWLCEYAEPNDADDLRSSDSHRPLLREIPFARIIEPAVLIFLIAFVAVVMLNQAFQWFRI